MSSVKVVAGFPLASSAVTVPFGNTYVAPVYEPPFALERVTANSKYSLASSPVAEFFFVICRLPELREFLKSTTMSPLSSVVTTPCEVE